MSDQTSKGPVLLIHGWNSAPRSFGVLPNRLSKAGYSVLPIFRAYRCARGVSIGDLADQLEADWSRHQYEVSKYPRKPAVIAHSMGGLVVRAWILRHYLSQGLDAPVRLILECGVPRHGALLRWPARTSLQWGLIPGADAGRDMLPPNPFLTELAWAEFNHREAMPPVVSLTGSLEGPSLFGLLIGGPNSDGVVPLICSNPNPFFALWRPDDSPDPVQLNCESGSARPALTWKGLAHSSRGGFFKVLAEDGQIAEGLLGAILELLQARTVNPAEFHAVPFSALESRRALLFLRSAQGTEIHVSAEKNSVARPRLVARREGLWLWEVGLSGEVNETARTLGVSDLWKN